MLWNYEGFAIKISFFFLGWRKSSDVSSVVLVVNWNFG